MFHFYPWDSRLLLVMALVHKGRKRRKVQKRTPQPCSFQHFFLPLMIMKKIIWKWKYGPVYNFFFSCMFLNPNIFFSNLNSNCSNLSDMTNLQEQVKKTLCYKKLLWPFTVWINCSSDLKKFANSQPSAPRISKVFLDH